MRVCNLGRSLVGVVLIVMNAGNAYSISGGVTVKNGNELSWGQYRSAKAPVVVEYPEHLTPDGDAEHFASFLCRHPLCGSDGVLLYLQNSEKPFFTEDGTGIEAEAKEDLRAKLKAMWKFDILPVLVLFDPDPGCRLKDAQAYAAAAVTLAKEYAEDGWFLLSVTDAADDPRWADGNSIDAVELITAVVSAVDDYNSDQPVTAACSGLKAGGELLKGIPLQVVSNRVQPDLLGKVYRPSLKRPTLEIGTASEIDEDRMVSILSKVGLVRLHDEFPYGIVLHFHDLPLEERREARDRFLDLLRTSVDRYQKEVTGASPPVPGDAASLKPGEAEEGFVALLNGKDLSGWVHITKPNDFVVRDGAAELVGFDGGWLRSWKPYKDFVFRGEYWIEEGGNSGFFIRAPLTGRESRIGFEFQIRGQPDDTVPDRESSGSIYYVRAPDGHFYKVNEWNEVEITCVGERVKIVWNGNLAHDFEYDDIEFAKNRATEGYIGLQDHHNLVKFRNVRIKELN